MLSVRKASRRLKIIFIPCNDTKTTVIMISSKLRASKLRDMFSEAGKHISFFSVIRLNDPYTIYNISRTSVDIKGLLSIAAEWIHNARLTDQNPFVYMTTLLFRFHIFRIRNEYPETSEAYLLPEPDR